jgi:hypothetical protein
MAKQEIRDVINYVSEKINETVAALGTDLKRDEEGFIVDDSDLGAALRMMEGASVQLSRLSFQIGLDDADR